MQFVFLGKHFLNLWIFSLIFWSYIFQFSSTSKNGRDFDNWSSPNKHNWIGYYEERAMNYLIWTAMKQDIENHIEGLSRKWWHRSHIQVLGWQPSKWGNPPSTTWSLGILTELSMLQHAACLGWWWWRWWPWYPRASAAPPPAGHRPRRTKLNSRIVAQ